MDIKVDCLIISTGRAASTAVYRYLSQACELNLPANKEPHHWFDMSKYNGLYPLLDRIYIPDRQKYFDLYSEASKVIDASCGYFYYLEEVINNLRADRKMPKVVFLYRDPVSRAASIFNEWRRKGFTLSKNVIQDVIKSKDLAPGFWWEYYYDNVLYMKQFDLMKRYFRDILIVNYSAFNRNPSSVFLKIANFTGIPVRRIIDYAPVNSSVEAKIFYSNNRLIKFYKSLPLIFQRILKKYLIRKSKEEDMAYYTELSKYLPVSVAQYDAFRQSINMEDVLCIQR